MIKKLENKEPIIHESCFIANTADIIGEVEIGKNSSVWYNAVIRGDDNYIKIGKNTNIQDNCIIHISQIYPTVIGDNVTIGHNAIIHAAKIGNNTLIGMGAILLDGSEVGDESIIGAGSIVSPGKKIPSGVLALGTPAKVIRALTEEEKESLRISAEKYVESANRHKK